MKTISQKLLSLKKRNLLFILLISTLLPITTLGQNVVVSGALNGNGSYPDLNSAFTAINSGAQTAANITVNIIGSTTETISATLNSGAWASVVIQPSGGSAMTVSGNLSAPLVDLNGADNVTINGLNSGGNSLTLSNTSTGNVLTTTLRFVADAGNNVVTNCTLLGSATTNTLGVISFSTASSIGNSSNTISNCNIGPAGANLPAVGIYASGTTSFDNANCTISNCNISDFFSASLSSYGIFLSANNTTWNITGNKLFQTALRTYTAAATHYGIQIAAGNNYTVSNNTIGYSSAGGAGTYAMTSTVATLFTGINMSVGTVSVSSVMGNTISAVSLTTSSGAATVNGVLCGINVGSGNVLVGTGSVGNVIGGNSGTDRFTANPGTTGGLVVGINSASTGTIVIQNNFIGALTSTNTSATISGNVTGINVSGLSTGLTISSNTVGNSVTDNMRAGTNGVTTANSVGVGIYMVANLTGTNTVVSNNLIQNISSFGTGTGSSMRGIWTASASSTGIYSISSNTIMNLTSNSGNVAVTTGQIGTAGIILATGTSCTVESNYISNIANTGTATGHCIVAGISNANGTNTVYRLNKIYNIRNTSPGTTVTGPPVAAGFFLRSGTNGLSINNNMISLGGGQTSNTSFIGIFGNHGSTPNPTVQAYYNTINIEGTVTSGSLPSFGIGRLDFSATAKVAPYDVKNNIITNTRSGGSGSHYAIANNYGASAASTTGWGTNASNNNVLNANASTVGWWTASTTFAGWQTASASDVTSYSGISVTYSNSASDLHLNMGLAPTVIESGAQSITGYTTDIDGQTRPGPVGSVNGGGLSPDIGADEIDGVVYTCTSVVAGTITPASGSACSGQTVSATSSSASTGMGIAYQWQVGTSSSGPFSNISGGSGATTVSYTSAPLSAGVFYVILKATCNTSIVATSNVVTLTVNGTPTASAVSSNSVICNGGTFSLTGSPGSGTTYTWTGPASFSSTTQNPVISNAGLNASGNYSFVSSSNGCNSAAGVVSVIVNQNPGSLTVTPSSTLICAGSSQSVQVTGGALNSVLNFTPQTNQNSSTTYPAPYSVYYGGQKMQFLILASELTAAGFSAGSSLTSIQFPVVSFGANWGSSIFDCQSYQVSIGNTALNSVGATFQTGLTIVSTASNFTPVVGYSNTHTFSSPFSWNGINNIIVETVFSNNLSGTTADAVISYNSPTSFQSTMVYRADSQPFSTIAAATSTNIGTNLIRPDFILKGNTPVSYTWSPSTGLSATSGTAVLATPLSNSIYTVQAMNGTCSSNTTVNLSVTQGPTLTIVSTSSDVCVGGSATLTAFGATNYTWSTTSSNTTEVVTPTINTVYTVSTQISPCPVTSASISIVANPLPNVTAASSGTAVCSGSLVYLAANGANSYSWSSGSVVANDTVAIYTNTIFTVVGFDNNGCSNTASVSVVSNSLPVVAISPASASVCISSPASFTASGANTYSWSPGGSNAVYTVVTSANAVYTVTGTSSQSCSSTQTVQLTALALPNISVSPASANICSGESVLITASGAPSYTWQPNNSNLAIITVSPSSSTIYTVTGTNTANCSASTSINIEVAPCTGIMNNSNLSRMTSVYPNPSSGLIIAKFEFDGDKQITVTNSTGAVIVKTNSTNYTETIDLGSYAKGIYFIKISSSDAFINYKVLIE